MLTRHVEHLDSDANDILNCPETFGDTPDGFTGAADRQSEQENGQRDCAKAQGDPNLGAGRKIMMFYWRMPMVDHDSFSGQQGWNSQLAEIYDSA